MNASVERLGFAGTTLCILAYLPQVIHLTRERCSAGLSTGAYSTWLMAALFLLSYAISTGDRVFIALQSYQVGAPTLILFFCVRYKGHLCEDHGGPASIDT